MPEAGALYYDELVARAGGLDQSHRWLLDAVPPGSTVLDVGCAGGYLAAELVEQRQCTVDGVEQDPAAAVRARRACRVVHVGSLDDDAFLRALAGRWDRILFGDVLEHLRSPEQVLAAMSRLLAPGGRMLVSIPNVAYWRVRLDLLRGNFRYTESGLLDSTHLRFYTYETAGELFEKAGLRVVRRDMTWRIPTRLGRLLAGPIVRAYPNVFAYQGLFELAPAGRGEGS